MGTSKRRWGTRLLALAIIAGGSVTSFSPLQAEDTLAQVGNYTLTRGDVQIIMEADPQIKELVKQKPELKGELEKLVVERWLNISLLSLYAKERGLDREPNIRKKLTEMEKHLLAEEVLQRELSGLKPTVEELKNFYEKNKELYTEPEGLKLKHILIFVPENADKETREKALAKAKKLREELKRGAKFEVLAKKYSDDTASRDKGGDLGILRRGVTIPDFENKVFAQKEGSISDPIASPYGYHIIKVEKRIPPKVKAFEEVQAQVEDDYIKEKERELLRNLIGDLRKRYQPQVYQSGEKGAISK